MSVKLSGNLRQEISGHVVEIQKRRIILEVDHKEYTLRKGQPFFFIVDTPIAPK